MAKHEAIGFCCQAMRASSSSDQSVDALDRPATGSRFAGQGEVATSNLMVRSPGSRRAQLRQVPRSYGSWSRCTYLLPMTCCKRRQGPRYVGVCSSPGLRAIGQATGSGIAGAIVNYVAARADFPDSNQSQRRIPSSDPNVVYQAWD